MTLTKVQMPGLDTPQFDWARNKLDNKYRPVGGVYEPELAARAVYKAALEGPRELWVRRMRSTRSWVSSSRRRSWIG